MKHGGDLLSYENYYDGVLIDFSSNINPIGVPKGLEQILIDNFKNIESYPDIKYRKLKRSISKYLGCEEESVLVGNGAVEIIDIFTSLANRVIVMEPSFAEYHERALVHSKEVVYISYKDDFTIDITNIKNLIGKGDLLILGNPNNPTGLRIERDVLIEIYKMIIDKGATLLLDEAFFEFVPKDYDSIEIFKEHNYENVGIIRAATKFFALPGIRLGYGVTSEKLIEKISKVQMPWSVNVFADIAGQYIFERLEYIKTSKEYIEKERTYLLKELSTIQDIKPYNTHSNYILIKLLKYNEEYVFNFLLKYGILVRKCSSFKTLGNNYIRVAVKDRDNNINLIKLLKRLYNKEEISMKKGKLLGD